MLLSRMFYFIESQKISEPIYTADQAPAGTSNKDFLQQYVANLLQNAFKNLQEYVTPSTSLLDTGSSQAVAILTIAECKSSNL
jgi:hypothetical protein